MVNLAHAYRKLKYVIKYVGITSFTFLGYFSIMCFKMLMLATCYVSTESPNILSQHKWENGLFFHHFFKQSLYCKYSVAG